VTGAAGFIGSHVCDSFVRDGHAVWGVDDLSTGRLENLADCARRPDFSFAKLDIVDAAFAEHLLTVESDVIVHLAAQMDVRKSVADPLADARVNVLGTVQLLAAASRRPGTRVVFASSGGTVYGEPETVPVRETDALRPLSPYGAAKVAGEAYVSAFGALHGLRYCVLAFGNVYGPRQDPHGEAGVVAIFARALLNGGPTRIFGDGSAVRDYVHVADAVRAVRLAADGNGDGRRFNVATGTGTSVRELHKLLAGIVGAPDAPELAPARAGELNRVVLDVHAAADHLGWTPTIELLDGLTETVDWARRP
jgi:UDP-glucose 4-epimerase